MKKRWIILVFLVVFLSLFALYLWAPTAFAAEEEPYPSHLRVSFEWGMEWSNGTHTTQVSVASNPESTLFFRQFGVLYHSQGWKWTVGPRGLLTAFPADPSYQGWLRTFSVGKNDTETWVHIAWNRDVCLPGPKIDIELWGEGIGEIFLENTTNFETLYVHHEGSQDWIDERQVNPLTTGVAAKVWIRTEQNYEDRSACLVITYNYRPPIIEGISLHRAGDGLDVEVTGRNFSPQYKTDADRLQFILKQGYEIVPLVNRMGDDRLIKWEDSSIKFHLEDIPKAAGNLQVRIDGWGSNYISLFGELTPAPPDRFVR